MSGLCLPSDALEDGLQWATKKAQTLTFLTVGLSFKGEKVSIPVQPSNAVLVCVDYLLDAYAGIDASSVKILHKGKKLDMLKSFEEQNVADGSKLMMIASSTTDVEKIQSSKSDPTIRGFENEKKLSLARQKGFDPSSSSAWKSQQHHEFKFSKLEMVSYEVGECTPHPYEAQSLLLKLATDPGIIGCMVKHKWHVSKLCEMDPRQDTIKKEGACTLGYNENFGARIYMRLRTDDLRSFRPYRELINTLLHELSHNVFGPHHTEFWSLFSSLKISYLQCHAELQRKGTIVGGVSAGKLADISHTGDAQNATEALSVELAASATNSALNPAEREAAARVAMNVSSIQAITNQLDQSNHTRTSSPQLKRMSNAREAAAIAAEQRMKSNKVISMEENQSSSSSSAVETDSGVSIDLGQGANLVKQVEGNEKGIVNKNEYKTRIQKKEDKNGATMETSSSMVMSEEPSSSVVSLENQNHDMITEESPVKKGGDIVQVVDRSRSIDIVKQSLETLIVAKNFGDVVTQQSALETLKILAKIISNLIKDPKDDRYRKLRKTNALFSRTIGYSEPAMEVISTLGFEIIEGNDEILLRQDQPDIETYSVILQLLNSE